MSQIRIGISGWRYAPWRGVFYPTGLPQRQELSFAASHFGSVEINGSFYSLQRPAYYAQWRSDTPARFVFAVKGGRFITHMKRLRDVRQALANFYASGLLCLEDKLGPVLWQFPENMPSDLARFDEFFTLLPRDTEAASTLAKQHAPWLGASGASVKGTARTATRVEVHRKLRHAVEIRNPACATPQFVRLLRRHGIGLVIADTAGRWPYLEDLTADFVYIRLHGDERLYESGYSKRAIERWAQRIQTWSRGGEPDDAKRVLPPARKRAARDVYVYFDNDVKVHAPFDAITLQRALHIEQPVPEQPRPQPRKRGLRRKA
jgi:uncharacterized protein YecE (DUF72 family)